MEQHPIPDELYLVADIARDDVTFAFNYSRTHVVFVETLPKKAQSQLANGDRLRVDILRENEFRAIPLWRIVEKLEEHGLFQELVDEFIKR